MKVSVIIPYNVSRGFLGDCLHAAEHQEGMTLGVDYEIIVQHGDKTVGVNINAALDKCKGKYIKLCAEDDMLAPGCLQALYSFAERTGCDFTCADAYNFEKPGQPSVKYCSTIPETVRQLAEMNTVHGGTILYRREAMPRFDESLWTGEEYELTLRMAEAGAKFGKLDEVVFWYRVHGKQKSLVYKSQDGDKILARYRFIRDIIQRSYCDSTKHIVKYVP